MKEIAGQPSGIRCLCFSCDSRKFDLEQTIFQFCLFQCHLHAKITLDLFKTYLTMQSKIPEPPYLPPRFLSHLTIFCKCLRCRSPVDLNFSSATCTSLPVVLHIVFVFYGLFWVWLSLDLISQAFHIQGILEFVAHLKLRMQTYLYINGNQAHSIAANLFYSPVTFVLFHGIFSRQDCGCICLFYI